MAILVQLFCEITVIGHLKLKYDEISIFSTKIVITQARMVQIAIFLCLNTSTCSCPSAEMMKSVEQNILILVSGEQTF